MNKKNITAAEFKRRFCNKAATARAVKAVNIREAVGSGEAKATAADKKALRTQWHSRDPNPGAFHKAERPDTNGRHLVLGMNAIRPVISL